MITFTYDDYIYYSRHIPIHFCEDTTFYDCIGLHNPHDKIYRDLLNNADEFSLFIKKFLGYYIAPNKLVKYNRNFVTKNYENRFSDIIYKIKDENTFFIVEHQSSIDGCISYRILDYYINLLQDNIPFPDDNDEPIFPTIIPILLYTGSRKWKLTPEIFTPPYNKYFIENPKIFLDFKYEFVDIHAYSKNSLINTDSIISYMLAIDKCKSTDEVFNTLETLSKIVISPVRRYTFRRLIKYIFSHFLSKKECVILLNKFSERDDVNMKWILDVVREDLEKQRKEAKLAGRNEGRKEGRALGISESIHTFIKKMLENGEDIEKIQLYSGSSLREIKKIQKEMNLI